MPIVGAINGYAIGMGFGIALATDLRIAADDARFQVTQMKRGLFADGGLGHLLPQAVGDQRALELMYTARMVGAEEALELGIVLKVVPREELMDAALELAEQIALSGPLGLAASKRVVYQAHRRALAAVAGVHRPRHRTVLPHRGLQGRRPVLRRTPRAAVPGTLAAGTARPGRRDTRG